MAMGDRGDCSASEMGVVADELTKTFSSEKTVDDFSASDELGLNGELLREASLARLAMVGTLLAELIFLTSIGRAVTFLAIMELLFAPKLAVWGSCGVLVLGVLPLEGVVAPDLTLTTFAWPRKAC